MLARLLVAAAIVVVALVVALVLRRRASGVDAPTQPRRHVPTQLDRADFTRPEAAWLVVLFSSATCATCADVREKARSVASDDVAVDDVEYIARRDLHTKYEIDSVPCLVITDGAGVVRHSFLGPLTATELWAALASARDAA